MKVQMNSREMNSRETNRRFVILTALAAFLILFGAKPAAAQDWFKTGTGLGVSKVRVAAPDFVIRGATSPALEKTFHDVLWNDLEYSGILELVSASF
jgi:TolB protein